MAKLGADKRTQPYVKTGSISSLFIVSPVKKNDDYERKHSNSSF